MWHVSHACRVQSVAPPGRPADGTSYLCETGRSIARPDCAARLRARFAARSRVCRTCRRHAAMKLPRLDTRLRLAVVAAIFGAVLATLGHGGGEQTQPRRRARHRPPLRRRQGGEVERAPRPASPTAWSSSATTASRFTSGASTQSRYRLRVAEQKEASGNRVAEFLGGNDILAINGGFFERDKQKVLAPSGLLIVDGKELAPEHERAGSGIVYANDNGVFIGYRKDLADHSRMKYARAGRSGAGRSGRQGRGRRQAARPPEPERHLPSRRRLRRRCGRQAASACFSWRACLPRPLADGGIGCDVALNLDGGPSTQALFRSGGRRIAVEGGSPVANALIVSPAANAP